MTRKQTSVSRSLDVWLAGRIGQDAYATMAQRLAWEVSEPGARPPTLVLYEPEPSITIGRAGSRTDIHLTDDELVSRQLAVRFVGRGGGAVLHGPGQVGIALFATLEDLGLDHHDVGGYLDRFESALEGAVREVRCGTARDSRISGVFGRTGLLAAVGVAIRRGVVWHGGFLNVERNSLPTHRVQTAPLAVGSAPRTMSSIEADVQRRVRLQDARSALVHQVVESFGFPQPHIQSGCPIFVSVARLSEPVSRAG